MNQAPMTRQEVIASLFKKIDTITLSIREVEAEISGKNTALSGFYANVEKGHPHFLSKVAMERQLKKDKMELVGLKGALVSAQDQLDAMLKEGA